MAEKIKLFELDIDADQALKDIAESRKRVEALTKSIEELAEAKEDNSEEIEKLTIARQLEQAEIRKTQKETKNLLAAQEDNIGTLERLQKENAALRTERFKLNLETDEGKQRLLEINQALDENNDFIKENSDQLKQQKLNVGNYKNSILQALTGTDAFNDGLKETAKGFGESTKAALKFLATPIGATIAVIAGAFKLLQGAFERSLSSQQKLTKITGKLSAALNVVYDALIPVVDFILDTAISALDAMGTIISTVVDGLVDMGILAESTAEDMAETVNAVDDLADAEERLALADRELQLLQLQYQTKAEKLRQLRDDETKSIAVRIQANEDLNALLLEQANLEQKQAQAILKIAEQRELVNGRSVASIEEITAAQVKVAEITERITSQQSEQQANLNSLRREQAALTKEQAEADANAANERSEARTKEDEEIEADFIRELEREDELTEKTVEATLARAEKVGQIAQQIAETKNQFQLDEANRELELAQGTIDKKFELESAALQQSLAQEKQAAEKIGASTLLIEKKYAKFQQDLERQKQQGKLAIASGFAGQIAQIAGEATAVGRIAAATQATIDTYRGAQSAFAQTPGGIVIKSIAAGLAAATGILNVKKILSTKSGLPNDSGGGGGVSVPTPAPAVSAPTEAVEAAPLEAIAPTVGEGIISRETAIDSTQADTKIVGVLPIDSVTEAQLDSDANSLSAIVA